jgi:hypothetical protein
MLFSRNAFGGGRQECGLLRGPSICCSSALCGRYGTIASDLTKSDVNRRRLLLLAGLAVSTSMFGSVAMAQSKTLLDVPLQLGPEWRGSVPADAKVVLERMRASCLGGLALRSDRQPEALRVDDHASGPPAVWLHKDSPQVAWVFVDVGERDWCNLAYQFGHELGHVLCNSWTSDARPRNPCQWLEEALVEASSLRGLGLLAETWERSPPFPHDNAYAGAIRKYRNDILARYETIANEQGMGGGFAVWFAKRKSWFDQHGGLDDARGAVPTMFSMMETDGAGVSALGAMNRWPERTGLPITEYLDRWEKSCAEIGAPPRFPGSVRQLMTA